MLTVLSIVVFLLNGCSNLDKLTKKPEPTPEPDSSVVPASKSSCFNWSSSETTSLSPTPSSTESSAPRATVVVSSTSTN